MVRPLSVCADNFRRWSTNPKIYVIAVLAILMENSMMVGPVRNFSESVNLPSTPWIYPFLTGDWYIVLLEVFGAILLFCDAPFVNEGTPYILVRAGKNAWFWGQLLYIIIASILYQLYLAIIGVLLLVPNLIWSPDWGKVLGTLAQTEAGDYLGVKLTESIVRQYTPFTATFLCFALCIIVTIFFGVLIFSVNLTFKSLWGPIIGSILALLMPFSINASGHFMFYYSPASWMSIGLLDSTGTTGYPSIYYPFVIGTILILLLAYYSFKRHNRIYIGMNYSI